MQAVRAQVSERSKAAADSFAHFLLLMLGIQALGLRMCAIKLGVQTTRLVLGVYQVKRTQHDGHQPNEIESRHG